MAVYSYPVPAGASPLAASVFRASFATLRLFYRVQVEGLHHIPADGPALMLGNHPSYLDPPIIYGLVSPQRRIHFMAWDKLWRVPLIRWYLDTFDGFPVALDRADADSYRKASQLLRAGQLLGVFPEGERSTVPGFHPIKRGAVRLAIRHRARLVPFAITGTRAAWPRHQLTPRPGRVRLVVLPPIEPPEPARGGQARVEQENALLRALHGQVNDVLVRRGELDAVPPLPTALDG